MTSEKKFVQIELDKLVMACFVIMPFSPTYQTLYKRIIKPAVEDSGLECVRADEVFSKPQITYEIWNQVRACRLVLAELTGKNPNVLYELGLAHAIGKPSIIITRHKDDVPFDLRALRYLYYDTNDPFWGENLRQQITEMIRSVIEHAEFGSIFESISIQGPIEFEKPIIETNKEKSIDVIDISGQWQGVFQFEQDDSETSWVAHIKQDDQLISGTLITSITDDNIMSVVQQSITGDIIGKKVRFHGISYQFIQRGNFENWHLDSFEGVINDDITAIVGIAHDEIENEGSVTLRR